MKKIVLEEFLTKNTYIDDPSLLSRFFNLKILRSNNTKHTSKRKKKKPKQYKYRTFLLHTITMVTMLMTIINENNR